MAHPAAPAISCWSAVSHPVGWQTHGSTASSDAPRVRIARFTLLLPANTPDSPIRYRRRRRILCMGKVCMPRGARPATAISMAKRFAAAGFTPPPANFKDPTTRSPCCKKAICSGGSRAASARRSKACHGKRPCRDGNLKRPMRTSGKSLWANMTEPDRNLEPGTSPSNFSDQRLLSN